MDIDFHTDISGSFTIGLGDSPRGVSGNRALVNRFEIVFLTKTRRYLLENGDITVDNFGGDAQKYINKPHVLNDIQSIASSVTISMEQTVKSILSDQPDSIPNTEKLSRAELLSVDIIGDVVFASIRVYPVEVEAYEQLVMNLPITKRN